MESRETFRYQKDNKIRNIIVTIVVIALIIGTAYVIYSNFFSNPLKQNVELEAGSKLDVKKFIDTSKYKVTVKKGLTNKQARTLGTHTITLTVKGKDYDATVKVVDTTKPVIKGVKKWHVDVNSKNDFKKGVSIEDNANGKTTLKVNTKKLNMKKEGTYKVTYTAKDASGNTAMKTTKVQVSDFAKLAKQKIIYLTFDDGPSYNTPKILKILKKYNATGTFFVTGQWPEYFKYITAAHKQGCYIAAHSYTHNFNIYRSEKTYFDDLNKIEEVIKKYTGKYSQDIRFPGGSSNTVSRHYATGIMKKLCKEVEKRGYVYVDWNIDSTDASGNNVPAARLIANGTSTYSKHLCLLMHDTGAKKTTVKALPKIIEYYKKHGYKFETLENSPYVFHQRINN